MPTLYYDGMIPGQETVNGSDASQDRIATLALLSVLVRGAEQPVAAAVEWEHALRSCPPTDVDARIGYLAARLSLPEVHPARLAETWDAALKGDVSPSRQDLLDLARRAVVTWDEPDPDIGPWRRAILARLKSTHSSFGALDLTSETPAEIRQSHLDLQPLLTDWPLRLLRHPDWAYVEAPLPEMAPLPLAGAWVDLRLVTAEESAAPPAGGGLRDALDLRYAQRSWHAEPLEFTLERLDGSAILVGPPGSGKTTLLKWIARRLITNPEGRFLLPLLLPLRAYAAWKREHPEGDLLDFGLAQAGIGERRQQELWTNALSYLAGSRGENVLLLLDGWDEVRQEDRAALRREIDDYSRGFSILLTTRPSGRPEDLPIHDLYEITELAPESIDRLIDRWFAHASAPSLAAALRTQLDRSLDLRRLARNPFLLTLLCGLALRAERNGGGSLPTSRAELYRAATELIYRQDDKRHGQARWPDARRRQVERLALWLLDKASDAPRYVFGSEDVVASGAERDLLDSYLKPSRLLAQWGLAPDEHHFLHATFQEYLAARGLGLAGPGDLLNHLRRHFFSGAWQEVFLFLAGLPGPAGQIFWRHMAQLARTPDRFGHLALRLARFAAEAGFEDGGRGELGIDLRDALWTGMLHLGAHELFVDAYTALDPAGLAERIQLALQESSDQVQALLLRALGRTVAAEASELLIDQILQDDSPTALAALAQISPQCRLDMQGHERLRAAALSSRAKPGVRRQAIWALGAFRDFATLDRMAVALRDDPADVEAVLFALSVRGADEVVTTISHLLAADNDPARGALFVNCLHRICNPAARDLLLEIVALRPAADPLVTKALNALAGRPIHRGGEVVIGLVSHQSSAELRAAAAGALEAANVAGVTDALIQAARLDREACVRIRALRSLKRRVPAADAPWLKATIRDDLKHEEERSLALEALAVAAQRFRRTTDAALVTPLAAGEILWLLEQPRGDRLTREAARLAPIVGDVVVPRLFAICRDDEMDHLLRCAACESLGRLRARGAAGLLRELLRRAPEAAVEHEDESAKLARIAAAALAEIDPALLLREPGTMAANALARWALETGSLVFDNRVVGPDGRVTAMAPTLDQEHPNPVPVALEEPAPASDLQLFVRTSATDGGHLSFRLKAGDPRIGFADDEYEPVKVHKPLRLFRSDLMLDLEGLSCADAESREVCRERLAVKGEVLFQLLPLGLQMWLWILKDRARTIELLSEDHYIPWELVRLRSQRGTSSAPRFLGEALAATRWQEGFPTCLALPLSRIALVAPRCDDLPSTAAERDYMLSLHVSGVREVIEIEDRYLPVKEALRSGDFDAWHFIGHADSRAEDPDLWRFPLAGGEALKPEDLRNAGKFGRLRPWVFLNACRTGHGGVALDGTSGWARRFLAAGAGAFFGTHWSVRDQGAYTFARIFYPRFLSGDALGEALRAVRNELLEEDPLTALSYTAFAHPLATCRSGGLSL